MRAWIPFLVVSGGLVVVGLGAGLGTSPGRGPADAEAGPRARVATAHESLAAAHATSGVEVDDLDTAAVLRGLWSRAPDDHPRDDTPVAFYYFHEGDIGLYRYGRIAHNTTNSYHWSVRDGRLELRWNKTGEVTTMAFRIDRSGAQPVLLLDGDPKNSGTSGSRYVFVPPPARAGCAPDLLQVQDRGLWSGDSPGSERIDNRLWMDIKKYATGGMGFSLYQLRAQGIDGRGTGWHHVGDFDDWSTEQLSYRVTRGPSPQLELLFTLRGERASTGFVVVEQKGPRGEFARTLRLQKDPRDFDAAHVYVDAGPSFAGFGGGR